MKQNNKIIIWKRLSFINYFIRKLIFLIINLLVKRPGINKIKKINFAVTHKCSSRCITCNIWRKSKKEPGLTKEELTLEQIKGIFNSKYLQHINCISLTGGDPLLRKDFVELCIFFINKYPGAALEISSNAVNPDFVIKKVEKIFNENNKGKIRLFISLDGMKEVHDKIRGIPGNYDNVMKLIKTVKMKFPGIIAGISFTIIPENYQDLIEIYKLSKKLNINFSCQFAQISEFFYENTLEELHKLKWNNNKFEEIKNVINTIIDDKIKNNTLTGESLYYYKGMISFKYNQSRKTNCYSGTSSFFLDPYGNLYPCIMLNKIIGNIKDGFDKLWISKNTSKIRKFIKKKKCFCWTPCECYLSLSKSREVIYSKFKDNLKRYFE